MKKIVFSIFFVLILSSAIFGQLKEFQIITEKPPALPPVFTSYPKKAAVIIHSSIPTLRFVSNTGGIVDNLSRPAEGKYILIVEPENQYITVKNPGFREAKFPVFGLKAKDVLYLTIEQKQEVVTAQGRLILNSIPDGANYQVAGFPIHGTTPANFSIAMGTYKIVFSKTGYKDKSVVVTVGKGETVSKTVELKLGLEIVSGKKPTPTTNAMISDIKTTGDLLTGARVENEPDKVNVYYNLSGKADENYKVNLIIKSRTKPDYQYQPQLLSGDIGKGKFAGTNRHIVWNIKKEMPGGFDTEGLYYELSAETVGGSGWLWWTGGILTAAGGAAYYFLVAKKGKKTPNTGNNGIPLPPVRPK